MLFPDRATHTVIIDRPCGTGKTTAMLASLQADRKYLLVTPSLTEVDRFIADSPPEVQISTPSDTCGPKLHDLSRLLDAGRSVAITHKLFNSMLVLAPKLQGYDIIIDEAPTPVEHHGGIEGNVFEEIMVQKGFAQVDPATRQVTPTAAWKKFEKCHVSKTSGEEVVTNGFYPDLYQNAAKGRLHADDSGVFVIAVPNQVLLSGRSLTIMSFLTEGTYIRVYLDMLAKADPRAAYTLHREGTEAWLNGVRKLVTVEGLDLPNGTNLSFSKQKGNTHDKTCRKIGNSLRNLVETRWKGVARSDILMTCARHKWFEDTKSRRAGQWARHSRLFGRDFGKGGVQWLPNKTRGTNLYAHASHLIYLYSMSPNPMVMNFLGCAGRAFSEAYAIAEMVQWVWRSRVRCGQPITLAVPCDRMRRLFTGWLASAESEADVTLLEAL
ncbi:DEAD/DEAH box helicase family protein [Jannaschia sp. 2305UL9-9]|uniref:DEAD/DEAH box helicase family protein n=1 Tax=Jannaschia sp. 2305UL9-9 TaxID=3121638 RepID=UPI0035282880